MWSIDYFLSHQIWHFSMSFCSFSLGNSILFYDFNYHLQNIPPNQSATLTCLLNFSLKCPNVSLTYAWVVCCHFQISMLKTNLSYCPHPNQLDDFHISILCTLSQVQTSMLAFIFLSSSFKDIFSFSDVSSHTIRIPLFIPVLCGSSTYHYLSFFILQAGNPWWILPFVYKSLCKHFYSFLIYQSFLVSTFFLNHSLSTFFLATLLFNINEIGQGRRWDGNVCMCSLTYICKVMYMLWWRFWVTETRINTKT